MASVHLILALDCSGSMRRVRTQLLEGYASFLQQQREQAGECVVTVATFSTEYSLVFEKKPLAEVPSDLELECGGMTSLYDTVTHLCRKYSRDSSLPTPTHVPTVLVVISDDRDTASRGTQAQMLAELERVKSQGWTVVCLCKSARDVPAELNPLASVPSEFGSVLRGQLSRVVSTARADSAREKSSQAGSSFFKCQSE